MSIEHKKELSHEVHHGELGNTIVFSRDAPDSNIDSIRVITCAAPDSLTAEQIKEFNQALFEDIGDITRDPEKPPIS